MVTRFCAFIASFLILTSSSVLPAQEELFIVREKKLIDHVIHSIDNAEHGISKLAPTVLAIHGMSSPKVRHLLNNLCSLSSTVYLEIGCWKGSTLVAALYGNQDTVIDAIAIENWSEFGSPRNDCYANMQTFIPSLPLRFFEADCFSIDRASVVRHPINIYFYDGRHEQSDQEQAFTYYDDVLDDVFIAVIDDWNWDNVRIGTDRAFKKLGYEVLYERALFTNANGDMNSWWNGIYIAVIKK
ncbi:MAG: hypothetical protein KGZ39_07405 [Simkania sp.]|nr:hypothetical protein [Simkania sp.]